MLKNWDDRRDFYIGKDTKEAIDFAVEHWIHSAARAIQQRGRFVVALSGGSTPRAIYQILSKNKEIDWGKVWFFFSDERAVPPEHPDSNYKMWLESGFKYLPIPSSHIFRMEGESEIEKHAKDYEKIIENTLDKHLFDLVMLGLGEDGHTASLFPKTKALEAKGSLVVANYLPEKNTWRMSFTFDCINNSRASVIYALGKTKQMIVPQVLDAAIDSPFPASRIGTTTSKCLWILDKDAAQLIENPE